MQCDAWISGLASILYNNENYEIKVIACYNRAVTPSESRYSITEPECLSVVCGVNRLSNLILGNSFTILSDQKSLLLLDQ